MSIFMILVLLTVSVNEAVNDEVLKEPGYEEVVVTATRTSQQKGSFGNAGYVLNREAIERSGKNSVVDLLKSVPGVFVKLQGGIGSVSSISLRGVPYKYTLVMLDGIKLADYMGNGGSGFPVLDHLSSDEIERIEVVYGPQSTLYGSDAVGGVIQIITRRGKGEREFWLSQELGSHGTSKTSFGVRGSSDKEDYSLFVSNLDADGFSEASRTNPNLFDGRAEDDGYKNLSTRLNLGFQHNNGSISRFKLHSIKANKEIDGFFDNDGPADQNSRSESSDLYFRLTHDRPSQTGLFEDHFSFSSARFNSENFIDSVSAFGPFVQNTRFIGSVKNLNWQRDYYFEDKILSFGWDFEQNYGRSLVEDKLKNNVVAYYVQNQWDLGEFSITAGARRDQHSTFGAKNTFKLSPSYKKGDYHFYGSYGTGFKAPTLYEFLSEELMMNWNIMQMVRINNSNLRPATSRGYSIGMIRQFDNEFRIGALYFNNDIEDNIAWDTVNYRFDNLGEVKTRGYEISVEKQINDKLNLNSSFSRSRSQEFPSGNQLRREPRHIFRTSASYQIDKESSVFIDYRQFGEQVERYASQFATAQVNQSYRVVDISYSTKISAQTRCDLRIENLMDDDYEEVFGYSNGGRKVYFTLSRTF